MSYNVLASMYVDSERYHYTPKEALGSEYRKQLLLEELKNYDPDIIAFQELEPEVLEFFKTHGVESYDFKYKSRNRPEGCGLFYKKNKFDCLSELNIEFNDISSYPQFDSRTFHFMTHNVGQLVLLESKQTNKKFWVANIHLFWNPKYYYVKLMQVYHLLKQIQSKVEDEPEIYPILILGDFNSYPGSEVFEYMSTGSLQKVPEELELNKKFKFEHPFKLLSAYDALEHPVTNITPDFTKPIDFIWYSRNDFELHSLLDTVDIEQEDVKFLPNANFPSDHVPIMARFSFKEESPSQQPT
uniref:Endonuclease/exonuclease/phosphatase domain-containing protein n=1 Tax=Arcella intermedia TaxID=1963864 RepID=A0A6B2LBI5_9EUKA|eukprot:TRINITY_DN4534_c0_g2_i1.p1 TRINITY_DN4534_c0_g2~~TRINITY_DN4534_c0_g2_i1.p1  ORF type:complete len:349 (-),score=93.71 TRINITY_DN4534_c0_g2_i1:25-921(-)